MTTVSIAYKGKGHLVYVHDDTQSNIWYARERRDALSTSDLVDFLGDIAGSKHNVIFPLRWPPAGYTSINQHYFETQLYPEMRKRDLIYKFSPDHPRVLETEKLERKIEKSKRLMQKRRRVQHRGK